MNLSKNRQPRLDDMTEAPSLCYEVAYWNRVILRVFLALVYILLVGHSKHNIL
jgi:hypothetical protein